MNGRRLALIGAGYVGLAALCTWPAVLRIGSAVPGAARTDLWNSLWSIWFVAEALGRGALPYRTALLDHPDGGTILIADPLGALFTAPLVPLVGLPAAYTLLVLARVAFSGLAAHLFARDLLRSRGEGSGPAPLVAGVAYATAPVLLAGVHNGTSEAFDGGPAALAAWACWSVASRGGARRAALAGLALLLAALASWYGAVVAFLFAGAFVFTGMASPWRARLGARAGALLLGVVLVAPVAAAFQHAATAPDNLVGIKNPRELASVRRTTGGADPRGFVLGGDFRSPDFRRISRYGEEFVHCTYLGWVLAGVSLLAFLPGARRERNGRDVAAIALAGAAGLVLSLGPVLVRDGQAVIVMGDRAIPLPYLLLEELPGFSSLSLVFRLAQAPALAFALLAALGCGGRSPRFVLAVCAGILAEGRFVSPLRGLPDLTPVGVPPAVEALRDAPPGGVMNFPVVGGREYLFEQTAHGKPVAGTLNFPNNLGARKVWSAMLEAAAEPPATFLAEVSRTARAAGIRYVAVHIDPMARPDMHDEAVRALKRAADPIGGSEGSADDPAGTSVRVYRLW